MRHFSSRMHGEGDYNMKEGNMFNDKILQILAELRQEKERLEEAILTIERLAVGSMGKRRGRPPKWLADMKANGTSAANSGKKRSRFSAATRKKMAESQRKRWAAFRKKNGTETESRRREVQEFGGARKVAKTLVPRGPRGARQAKERAAAK